MGNIGGFLIPSFMTMPAKDTVLPISVAASSAMPTCAGNEPNLNMCPNLLWVKQFRLFEFKSRSQGPAAESAGCSHDQDIGIGCFDLPPSVAWSRMPTCFHNATGVAPLTQTAAVVAPVKPADPKTGKLQPNGVDTGAVLASLVHSSLETGSNGGPSSAFQCTANAYLKANHSAQLFAQAQADYTANLAEVRLRNRAEQAISAILLAIPPLLPFFDFTRVERNGQSWIDGCLCCSNVRAATF